MNTPAPNRNPERTMHNYDGMSDHCSRCYAAKWAIVDGFVSPLCSGKPIVRLSAPKRLVNFFKTAWNYE